jgi:hypothetical protein
MGYSRHHINRGRYASHKAAKINGENRMFIYLAPRAIQPVVAEKSS